MTYRKTLVSAMAVVLMPLALVVACSSNNSNSKSGTNAKSSTVSVALPEAPVSLDLEGTAGAEDSSIEIAKQVFDTLVRRNDNGTYEPSLATKWSTPDPDTWVFTLRSDAKFSNGKSVTAMDVVASLQRTIAQRGPIAAIWKSLASVVASDSTTVTFHTSVPMGTMLANLTLLWVAPADLIGQAGFWTKPVGSGPFVLNSFVPQQSASLSANSTYWGGKPKISTLNYVWIPEASTLASALKTGQVTVALNLSPNQTPVLKGDSDVTVQQNPSFEYFYLWFNAGKAPFSDVRVRQAMSYALPLSQIVPAIVGGYGKVADGPIPPAVFGSKSSPPYPYDAAKAKQLLRDAGYPNGFTSSIMWSANQAPYMQDLLTVFNSYWAKIGVTVNLTQLDSATWLDKLLKLNWDMNLGVNSVLTGDADFALGRLYLSSANRMGYKNPDLDKVLLEAQQTQDQKQRQQLYGQAIKIIHDQAVGIYPLNINITTAWRSSLIGYKPAASGLPYFQDVG